MLDWIELTIKNPLIIKNISTPAYPPAAKLRPEWNKTTAITAIALSPLISALYLLIVCISCFNLKCSGQCFFATVLYSFQCFFQLYSALNHSYVDAVLAENSSQ